MMLVLVLRDQEGDCRGAANVVLQIRPGQPSSKPGETGAM